MSNRYSLSQTCNPRPTYRVIDHTFDDEIARYPATLPNGSPHQQPRWQDRYAVAIAWGTSARRLLDVLNRRDAF